MSKKFGIMTYHNANNYGAVLQAYALQTFLNCLFGEDSTEVINYQCEGVRKQRQLSYYLSNSNPFSGIAHYLFARNRIKKIMRFCQDNISLSKQINTKEELCELSNNYKYIISGSDQVWNRKWTGGEDTYLQDFHDVSEKKCSYAASFGLANLPDEWIDDYKRLLNDFSYISVREEAGKRIIYDTFELDSEVHVDPSVLLTPKQWNEVAEKTNLINEKFVLVYMVPYQDSVMSKAKEIANQNDLKLVLVCKSIKRKSGIYKGTASVEEIIALFRDAEYVVTNSFHGTAFSVIYQKRFYVELNNKIGFNVRSAQLLKKCGIMVDETPLDIVECLNVDWNKVTDILETERRKAEEYFRRMQ